MNGVRSRKAVNGQRRTTMACSDPTKVESKHTGIHAMTRFLKGSTTVKNARWRAAFTFPPSVGARHRLAER